MKQEESQESEASWEWGEKVSRRRKCSAVSSPENLMTMGFSRVFVVYTQTCSWTALSQFRVVGERKTVGGG